MTLGWHKSLCSTNIEFTCEASPRPLAQGFVGYSELAVHSAPVSFVGARRSVYTAIADIGGSLSVAIVSHWVLPLVFLDSVSQEVKHGKRAS